MGNPNIVKNWDKHSTMKKKNWEESPKNTKQTKVDWFKKKKLSIQVHLRANVIWSQETEPEKNEVERHPLPPSGQRVCV